MPGQWSKTKAWPEGSRECVLCLQIKSLDQFDLHRQGYKGHNCRCRECRKPISKVQYLNTSPEILIYQRAKSRSTRKGYEFDLDLEDIVIPDICPVFKIPMDVPSIDRINSSKGYTKDNIRIISNRANVLKNNATIEELELILADLRRHK